MNAAELIESLEKDHMERLRWLVLREFGIIPGSKRALCISDWDILRCAAHMVIDSRDSDADIGEQGQNGSFDKERFKRLSEGQF